MTIPDYLTDIVQRRNTNNYLEIAQHAPDDISWLVKEIYRLEKEIARLELKLEDYIRGGGR